MELITVQKKPSHRLFEELFISRFLLHKNNIDYQFYEKITDKFNKTLITRF